MQLKKTLIRYATDKDLKELQSICADVLYARIGVAEDWKRQLKRHRERFYALAGAESPTVFRRLLQKASNLRTLALILSSALNVILGREPTVEEVEVPQTEEVLPES